VLVWVGDVFAWNFETSKFMNLYNLERLSCKFEKLWKRSFFMKKWVHETYLLLYHFMVLQLKASLPWLWHLLSFWMLLWTCPHKRCPSPSLRSRPCYYVFFFHHLQTFVWLISNSISTTYIYNATYYHSNSTTYYYYALWMVKVFQKIVIVCCCGSNLYVHTNQFVTNLFEVQQNIVSHF
jgi:hypothetical protein